MKRSAFQGCRVAALWVVMAAWTGVAAASPPSYFPSYLLIRPETGRTHGMHAYAGNPGYGVPVYRPGYSYGWFGCGRKRIGRGTTATTATTLSGRRSMRKSFNGKPQLPRRRVKWSTT